MATNLEFLIKAKDEASKELDGISGKIQGMKNQLKIAGGVMVAAGGGITAALGMATKAAAQEEAGTIKLVQALKNAGVSYDDVKASLEGVIDATQQKTAVADDKQREALSELIGITGNYEESLSLMTLAMDLARAKNIDLTMAAQIVGRVSAGNTSILSRYGIVLEEGATAAEALGEMQAKFGGQAEAYGKTMSGQMELLQNNIGDVKEAIGKVIMEAIVPLTEKLGPILQQVKAWIAEHPELVKWLTLGAAAVGLILIPLGTFLIMLPMLTAGITTLTAASSPWLLIIGAIVVAIVLLIAAGVLLYQNWDTICKWAGNVWDWMKKLYDIIKEKVLKILATLSGYWDTVKGAIISFLSAALQPLVSGWQSVVDVVTNVINVLRTAWEWITKLGGSKGPTVNISGGIPSFQAGGVMPWTGPAFLHAGETILPAGTLITIPIYLDGDLIAEHVIDIAGGRAAMQRI